MPAYPACISSSAPKQGFNTVVFWDIRTQSQPTAISRLSAVGLTGNTIEFLLGSLQLLSIIEPKERDLRICDYMSAWSSP